VAIDNAQVRAIGLDGRLGPKFGPLFDNVISRATRISLLPSGDVLVVPGSSVFRWEPRTGVTMQSNDYPFPLPTMNSVETDTVYVPCDATGCVVHRVTHGARPVADIETTAIGDFPTGIVQTILPFATGMRAIVINREGKLYMAYLPVGGELEALLDTKVPAGGHFAKRDASTHGYVDASGKFMKSSLFRGACAKLVWRWAKASSRDSNGMRPRRNGASSIPKAPKCSCRELSGLPSAMQDGACFGDYPSNRTCK
jgi:hypothetical protein